MRVGTLNSSFHLRHSCSFVFFCMLSFVLRPPKKKKKEFENFFPSRFLFFCVAFCIIYFDVNQQISFVIHFSFQLDFNIHTNHKHFFGQL